MYKDLHKKLNHMASAANHLRLAAAQLAAVRLTNDSFMDDDALHYIAMIDALLSSDGGESGIDSMIRKLQARLESMPTEEREAKQ